MAQLTKLHLVMLVCIGMTIYHLVFKKPLTADAAVCAALPKDPSTLPYISYSTQEGFDDCVARCMTSVMQQVCRQLPDNSNVFETQPRMKQEMLEGCTQNIKDFVAHNTRCPHLNCMP